MNLSAHKLSRTLYYSVAFWAQNLLESKTVIPVAQPVNEWIQTAAYEDQKRQTVVQFSVHLDFSRHCQRVIGLTWR